MGAERFRRLNEKPTHFHESGDFPAALRTGANEKFATLLHDLICHLKHSRMPPAPLLVPAAAATWAYARHGGEAAGPQA